MLNMHVYVLKKTVGDFKLELYLNLIERRVSREIQKSKLIGGRTNVLSNKCKINAFYHKSVSLSLDTVCYIPLLISKCLSIE